MINFALLISCILNSCEIIFRLVNPELPSIREFNKDLKDIDFPVSFRICLNDLSGNFDRYHNLGYNNAYDFFNGISKCNKSLVGWNGHTKDGETVGTTEGQ